MEYLGFITQVYMPGINIGSLAINFNLASYT